MSKIVQAVNAMISNQALITEVVKGDKEIFFRYKAKYTWSMRKESSTHYLWYYPNHEIDYLLGCEVENEWNGVDMVGYNDTEIGTREAKASFAELFLLLKEKMFGVNNVLDDIISDGDPF
jgi:hypothetical protein